MKNKSEKDDIGTLHSAKSMFLHRGIGSAKLGPLEYDMSIFPGSGTPLVRSGKTGKWFTMNWEEIIELARKKGIDEPGSEQEGA